MDMDIINLNLAIMNLAMKCAEKMGMNPDADSVIEAYRKLKAEIEKQEV